MLLLMTICRYGPGTGDLKDEVDLDRDALPPQPEPDPHSLERPLWSVQTDKWVLGRWEPMENSSYILYVYT